MRRARLAAPTGSARRSLLRALGLIGAIVVTSSALVLGSGAAPATALTGHVQGVVFRDFNQNGVYDSTAVNGVTDATLAGVTATAYSAAGTAVGSAVSAASGIYDITIVPSLPDGTPLRIEFSGYPAGFIDSFNGTGNSTSVQFSTVGATGVNFALHRPTDYSRGTSTPLLTAVLTNGSPDLDYGSTTAANAMETTIRNASAITAVLPVNATPSVTVPSTVASTVATFGEVGAIWGLTMQPLGPVAGGERYYIYASSVLRRHSGWGEAAGSTLRGIDGLYRLDVTVAANGSVTRTALASYDLTAGSANYGSVTRDLTDTQTASGVQSLDTNAFAAIGTVGIGGIQYHDGKLYVVNLNDRDVWVYDASSFGAGPTAPTPTVIDTGLSGVDRPWAITVRDDRIYVGVTNTATLATGSRVISRAISGGTWSTDLTVPLNYSRGIAWAADPPANPVTTGQPAAQWHAWQDNPTTIWNDANSSVTFFRAWAQPILSGLSFDDGGNLTLGFIDRFGFQTGAAALFPGGTGSGNSYSRSNVTGTPNGEVLYAGRGAAGTLTLESGGTGATGGNVTSTTAGNSTAVLAPSYGTAAQNRPATTVPAPGQTARQNIQHGGREFFEDSVIWDGGGSPAENPAEGVVHDETTLGAVAIVPGTSQLTTTSFDAGLRYFGAGNRFLSLTDGRSMAGFDQYFGTNPYFGKASGLGGIAYLLSDAPVEVGNRVWYDADLDGIQDADEAAINDAPVQLWTADAGGNPVTQLASTTTATINGQAGTYFFRTADAASGGTPGFVKDANYVIVFPQPGSGSPTLVWPSTVPTGFTGLTWAQLTRTTPTAGSNALIDSNPAVATGRALVTVGSTGENDHSIDAGWYGVSTFQLQKNVVGTPPAGATYSIEIASATDFRGANRLGTGGAPTLPIVDTLGYTLTAGELEISVEQIPYGYTLTFTEADMPAAAVSFSPNTGVGDDTGQLLISPTGVAGGQLLTITNSYTSIEITKSLSSAVSLPADTTFPIEYAIDGGPVQTTDVAVGPSETLTIDGVPWGADVDVREPLEGPFSWGGWIWRTGTWTLGATELIPDVDGWVTVTAGTSTDPLELMLTNHPIEPPALPFTGGLASDAFAIAGASGVVIAIALGLWQFARRRRPRRLGLHRS
jgi:hypothetical protein